jgi:ABC-type transport system involved in multi-copper enzyme maturation permease subunit
MLPGPVFNVELLTTARRARYYVIRFAYGMMLLFFVVQMVGPWSGEGAGLWQGGELTVSEMAATGWSIFATLTVFQWAAVLVLTPALVAGVIAEEKRRRTMQYLMVSRLSSAEVVLGKLFARLLHVGIFLAIGLPVMSLISLFGGVEPGLVLLSYGAILSTALFLAALATLISTFARRPREASAQVYIVELAWLFGPSLVAQLMAAPGLAWLGPLYDWVRPVNDWLLWSGPLALFEPYAQAAPLGACFCMLGLQLGAAVVFVLVAIVALRPIVRRDGEGGRRPWAIAPARWRRRLFPRPAVGDDPMLWKERYAPRARGLIALLVGFLFVIGCTILVYTTYLSAAPAFIELWHHGYSSAGAYSARRYLHFQLRLVCMLLYVVWCLAVASVAATGVVGEREEDTWTSLITTPLEGDEILRAKMFGAVWGTRWLGVPLFLLWLLGLASGAVHPLGFLAIAVETAVFIWFVSALGVFLSLTSKSSARAQTATMAILVTVNGFYLFCCLPLHPESRFCLAGITPLIEWISLLSYESISWFYDKPSSAQETEAPLTCLMGVFLYAAAALYLTNSAFVSFDTRVDRPRRGWEQSGVRGHKERFVNDDDSA